MKPLGYRLYLALDDARNKGQWIIHECPRGEICALLNELAEALRAWRKAHAYSDHSDEFIVQYIYTPRETLSTPLEQARWEDATSQCIVAFLDWSSLQLSFEKGGLPTDHLLNFVCSLVELHLFPEIFGEVKECWRAGSPVGMAYYRALRELLYLHNIDDSLVAELFCVFGLRQGLEAALNRILGFHSIEPDFRRPSTLVFDILKKYEKQILFCKEKTISFERLKTIYLWTNRSIHSMYTDYAWRIWMAVKTSYFLFDIGGQIRGGTGQTFPNIRVPLDLFLHMRQELAEELKAIVLKEKKKGRFQGDSFKIHWETLEAFVMADAYDAVHVKNFVQTVFLAEPPPFSLDSLFGPRPFLEGTPDECP